MSTRVLVEQPAVGEYVVVYFEHGWFQLKREVEGVVYDFFNSDDENICSGWLMNGELDAGAPE